MTSMQHTSEIDDTLSSNAGALIAVIISGMLGLAASMALAEMLGAPDHYIIPVLPLFVLAVVAMIGWSARTSDRARFFCSSHGLPPVAGALASLAAWFAVMPFLPFAGALYSGGFDSLAFVLGPIAGLLISGILIVPYLAAAKAETLAQFMGQRAGAIAEALVAVVVLCVSFVVFAAALQVAAAFGASAFHLPFQVCLGVAVAAAVVSALPGGSNGANWTGMAYALFFLIGLAVAGAVIAYKIVGLPSAQIGAAIALRDITDLEFSMIEKGAAAATSLKLHSKPSGSRDLFLLIVATLAFATAAVPMMLQTFMAQRSLRPARTSSSWLIVFATYVALSAIAWSAFAKHAVYKTTDQQSKFEALPDWLEPLMAAGALKIYGVSLDLVDRIEPAVSSGAKTPAQVGATLTASNAALGKSWAALKEPVKAELIRTAEAMAQQSSASPNFKWRAFLDNVLPVAAKAAGNTTGAVTLQSLQIDPERLISALPHITRLPSAVLSLVLAALLCVPFAIAASALAMAASALNHDLLESMFGTEHVAAMEPLGTRSCIGLLAAVGFVVAGLGNNLSVLAVLLIAVASATLLPALVAGIWSRRAGGYAIVLGMLSALTVASLMAWPGMTSATTIISAWTAIAKSGSVIWATLAGLVVTLLSSFVLPRPTTAQVELISTARGMSPTEM